MESAAPKAARLTIDDIARRIGEGCGAWRVVLFGSQARGDAREYSDYDLYVELDAPRESLPAMRHQIRAELGDYLLEWSIDLHVHPAGEIERRSADPGTMEWDVCREGILLYADPAASGLSVPQRVCEPSRRHPESVPEWLERAEEDMGLARHLLEHRLSWSYVCFHGQQTAEKCMKALIVSRGLRPKRTHELAVLVADLRDAGCNLSVLQEDCEGLSDYAVTARYGSSGINEGQARAALAAAERIVAAVRRVLPEPSRAGCERS